MAEQSFLVKLGLRFGAVGASVGLAFAAPIANADYSTSAGTAANRTGWYFDMTAAAERVLSVVGGQAGTVYTRSGSVVAAQFTGACTIPSGVNPVINGAAGTSRGVLCYTGGLTRWFELTTSGTESGANAGSSYQIAAYTDAGVVLDLPVTITRAATTNFSIPRPIFLATGAVAATAILSSNAGTSRQFSARTTTVSRWLTGANNTAESGANAGSNYFLQTFNDAGTTIDSPISINRVALGSATIVRPITHSAGTLTGASTAFSTTATWNNGASTFTGWKFNSTATALAAGSLLVDLQVGGVSCFNVAGGGGNNTTGSVIQSVIDTDLLATPSFSCSRTTMITVGVTDGLGMTSSPVINGLFTVTRMNYIELDTPTGSSTVTDACVFNFNAAAGTHCCVDASSTKTTPGTTNGWMVVNVAGTLYYAPIYTSKTT